MRGTLHTGRSARPYGGFNCWSRAAASAGRSRCFWAEGTCRGFRAPDAILTTSPGRRLTSTRRLCCYISPLARAANKEGLALGAVAIDVAGYARDRAFLTRDDVYKGAA